MVHPIRRISAAIPVAGLENHWALVGTAEGGLHIVEAIKAPWL